MQTATLSRPGAAAAAPAPWTTPQALEAVRPRVRELLTAIPAFAALTPVEQRDLAANMVKVLAYISDPNGVVTEADSASRTPTLARAQAEDAAINRMNAVADSSPGQVEFKANAGREGVQLFGEMVQKVDFPKFVGGLIKNVFQAIVESSIEQMRAYGELIGNVAKSVGDFANDNISQSAGRDWLAEKYPDTFEVQANPQAGGFADGDDRRAATGRADGHR